MAAAIQAGRREKLSKCFSAEDLDSRPTEQQTAIFRAINDYLIRYVRAANQCLAEGTLVATPSGPRPIEEIQVGDMVYSENGTPIRVLQTFDNGEKEVADITVRNVPWASCAAEHVWLTRAGELSAGTFDSGNEIALGAPDLGVFSFVPATWGANKRVVRTYDIHVASSTNLYLLANGLVTHNSGKSRLAGREIAWLLTGTHPYFVKPPEWGNEPLLILIAGQDRMQMEANLWRRILLPFLNPEDWKETKSGNQLVMAQHRTEGHQIIFISHNNSSDTDISHMQSYAAHYVWADEMPKSPRVLEELQQRIAAKRGRFIATFTAKVRADAIRKMVDDADPSVAKTFPLARLDNPIYHGREEEELAKVANLPEALRRAILFGDWITSDSAVYTFVPEVHSGKPERYGPQWRHVLSVDPATESAIGVTVWAEEPSTGTWWCVVAEYVDGTQVPTKAPTDYIYFVERMVKGLNVVQRIYDSAAPWWARQALRMPGGERFVYLPVQDKPGNKQTFIAQFQQALGSDIRVAEWCTSLIAEIESCERSETNPEKLVNRSRFHLIDSAHYFLARKPPRTIQQTFETHADYVLAYDDAARLRERSAVVAAAKRAHLIRPRRASFRR